MDPNITSEIKKKAALILEEIKKANSVLLHFHPSPDPDSVGAALAMRFALEQIGKKASVIKGDSVMPPAFMHFPGATDVLSQNFFETDLSKYDLFIILDSAAPEMISRFKPVNFPLPIRTVVIDHHRTNRGFGDINLVSPESPATCQLLYEVFSFWKIKITPEIATNLYVGLYTDTMFKYEGVTPRTFEIAAELLKQIPDMPGIIAKMENSFTPEAIYLEGMALSMIETFFDGKVALSLVPFEAIKEKNIPVTDVRAGEISPILNTVKDWNIVGTLFEVEKGKIRASFRTHDSERYDVSKLAAAFGGGGHKAAAGAVLQMTMEDARKKVVDKMRELYNL